MRLSYDPIYESGSAGLVMTLVVIALLFWIMPTGISPRRRAVLLALRGLAAVMLVLAMLRPSFVRSDNRPDAATLAIAIDASRSMTLASGDTSAQPSTAVETVPGGIGGAESRWQQQRRVLDELGTGLLSLDDRLDVNLYRFANESERIGGGSAGDLPSSVAVLGELPPDGRLTNLASPLETAIATSRSTPLAGIVLISDGTHTAQAESDQSTDPGAAAQWAAAIGVPLWTVALGPPAVGNQIRDVSVSALPDTYRMFTGNETDVAFEFQTRGYAGQPIELSIIWVSEAGQETTAATRTITPDQDVYREAMTLPVVAPERGSYRLIVGARSPAGETDITNDQQLSFVDVREGGGRVLYLEGTPRLEQRYLRRALRRFPDLELTYRWIPRDTSSRWPIDFTDDLQSGQFDVIILGDLHSAALGKEQLDQIAALVGNGAALLTLGGERAYGPGGYADATLAKVLPVQLEAGLTQPAGEKFRDLALAPGTDGANAALPGQTNGPITLQMATPHPITRVDADASKSDEEEWASLPAMPGANRFAGVKVAPGVQVLLEDNTGQPMMVVGEYGKGRVASLAFDSTWMWWTSGASEFHRRFWRQSVLWLLSREESTEGELELNMTRRRMSTSDTTRFTATRLASGDAAAQPAEWSAEVISETGEARSVEISVTPKTAGNESRIEVTGEISGDSQTAGDASQSSRLPPGIYQLRVRSGDEGREIASAELPFQVVDDTREVAARNTDHALLDRLALITEAAGGQSYRADQIAALIDRIATQRRRAERVIIEKWRLGDSALSGWLVFSLFAGCLCSEWTLRRRWGLA